MADEIPPTFWDSLGPNGAVLCTIIGNQTRMLEQLQQQNIALQAEVHSAHSNIVDAAAAAATTIAQNIHFSLPTVPTTTSIPTTTPIPTAVPVPNLLTCQLKGVDPERFNGNWSRTKEFLCMIKLVVAILPVVFLEDRFKILYMLSFMTKGLVQIWAHNITDAVIGGMSMIVMFAEFVKHVEYASSDPDRICTAQTKLCDLCMLPGMTTDDYTMQFEILASHASFNDEALE